MFHTETADTIQSPIIPSYVPQPLQNKTPPPIEFWPVHQLDHLTLAVIYVTFPSTLGRISEDICPFPASEDGGSSVEESNYEISDNSEIE